MLVIDEKSKVPLYVQLYQQIKAGILNGNITIGTKLPSSRKLSVDLQISRNTVELAYEQLGAEGFIVSMPRQGYYVESLGLETFNKSETAPAAQLEPAGQPPQTIPYDFRAGKLYSGEIPFTHWKRLTSKCFRDYREELAQCGHVFGEPGLRAEIQKYIHAYRGVNCSAEQIVVGTATQFCLALICRLIQAKGWGVAMEEPGSDWSRATFRNHGLKIYPVEIDAHGLNVALLKPMDAVAAYVTPSHQYPVGVLMPLTRRLELIEWVKDREAVIIEDDYNCHFQYDVKQIPSLQSLCNDKVIYMGSFSDLLFPTIRISYMVITPHLLKELHKRFDDNAPFVPFLAQKILELFMQEGYWDSHIRKTVKHQKKKWEALISALQYEFGNKIRIVGRHGGLHLLIQAKWPMPEDELIRRAYQAGVGVYPTAKYWSRLQSSEQGTVLLNFGGMVLEHIPIAIQLLRQAWLGEKSGAI